MTYSAEICQLVIRNIELAEETPKIIDYIEKKIFSAINNKIKNKIESLNDWDGCYDFITEINDSETVFAPNNWPKGKDGSFIAYYKFAENKETDNANFYLSASVGINNCTLIIKFCVDLNYYKLSKKDYKNILEEFYTKYLIIQEMGFYLEKEGYIYRPFSFDIELLSKEYPDFDECLNPLEDTLLALMNIHTKFDELIINIQNKLSIR